MILQPNIRRTFPGSSTTPTTNEFRGGGGKHFGKALRPHDDDEDDDGDDSEDSEASDHGNNNVQVVNHAPRGGGKQLGGGKYLRP